MGYRTVTITARVYSGSDDHAKWQAYWGLSENEYVEDVLIDEIDVKQKDRGGVA